MVQRFTLPFFPGSSRRNGEGETGTGRSGEDMAVSYLQRRGYTVLARNYRQRFGEIDVVAEKGDTLVFVEVKTRRNDRYGSPLEAVDQRKQRKLARMAQDYISRHNMEDRAARFDVLAVYILGDSRHEIEHIRDAFEVQE